MLKQPRAKWTSPTYRSVPVLRGRAVPRSPTRGSAEDARQGAGSMCQMHVLCRFSTVHPSEHTLHPRLRVPGRGPQRLRAGGVESHWCVDGVKCAAEYITSALRQSGHTQEPPVHNGTESLHPSGHKADATGACADRSVRSCPYCTPHSSTHTQPHTHIHHRTRPN